MKELYTDLQNQYGQNLEDAPSNFSMEAYLKQKAQEIVDAKNAENYSVCCGADLRTMVCEDGPDYKDLSMCPDCKEYI